MHSSNDPLTGPLSLDQLRAAVASGEIRTVMIGVPDMMGRLKGKEFDASAFVKDLPVTEACAYILATDADMTPLPGFALTGWEHGYGDFTLIPDEHTIRRLGYLDGTALILADPADPEGRPVEVAPRHILRTQLDRLTGLGYEVRVGLEPEFLLYEDTEHSTANKRDLRPVALHNLDYALDRPPALSDFLQDLRDALRAAGLPPESVKLEGANGQVEVTFPYGPALPACDAHIVFKHAVRHVAARRGLTPTFMAAPETGVGSGLHVHLSLWKDDEPAFATPSRWDVLPETMQRAIAGLISGLPHLAPLYAPTVNSYKRYRPYSFAPTHFTWGIDNRGCAVRVTGHDQGTRLEIRAPGADANPYLAVAAACAAIHHGLTKSPELPPLYLGDPYQAVDELPVPGDLAAALGDFDGSQLAVDAFGESVVRHYAHAAHIEIEAHRALVTDIERQRGLERA
ncbi:glutamine synthetase family protein [Streptomyces ipomoeae]|uniref:glutamine synthetase family protein n=1 Tax=Streptomyces ipomoeae TaxID=103232 RepID=UPI0029BEBB43|nr:glutamine synthetase family protein [Streptomyces ipomoeae]MDX2826266.1 glutamine synthetase family protein [Streptomyces ipomoeae]MDX2878968.1 glutamine synthetase family protein [Streptomyces ipomoeae]